jgi:PepSY-associated TM region
MVALGLPQLKAALIVVHRYTSAALCLLFATWFISGLAMAYRHEPPLTDEQRLAFAPSLNPASGAVPPGQIPALADDWAEVQALRLGQWRGRPVYRWLSSVGWQAAWGDTGAAAMFDAAALEPEAARWFGPGTPFRYDGVFEEEGQWSYFSTNRPHYPLHGFSTAGIGGRQVFFSSRTGEPVVATTFGIRLLYYLGPGLHYFSLYPIRNNDPLWRAVVIASSSIGVMSCLAGIIIGLWQLRWRAIGTGRRVVPYARPWMRWHHWIGLAFGLVTFTFVLSGLFSMNPAALFPAPDVPAALGAALQGSHTSVDALPPPASLDSLEDAVKELEWKRLRGQPYLVARRDLATERLLWPDAAGVAPRPPFTDDELVGFVRDLLPAPIQRIERVPHFDDYYYTRHGRHLPLPVLRLRLQDEQSTWYYMDPDTGHLVMKSDDGTRARRWLYNGLHSFDVQWLLRNGWWWDLTIWLLSLGGLGLSVTGVVITWHWIQRSVSPAVAAPLSGRRANTASRQIARLRHLNERKVD